MSAPNTALRWILALFPIGLLATVAVLHGPADPAGAPAIREAIGVSATAASGAARARRPEVLERVLDGRFRAQTATLEPADYERAVGGLNRFAERWIRELGSTGRNVVSSPIALAITLALCRAGANGETAFEIDRVLDHGLSAEALHRAMNGLTSQVMHQASPESDGNKVEILLGKGLWVAPDVSLRPSYLNLVKAKYPLLLGKLDFSTSPNDAALAVNREVSRATGGRVADLLDASSLTSDTKALLTSTLFFYASWRRPFPKGLTNSANFENLDGALQRVWMMHKTDSFPHHRGEGYVSVDVPYTGNALTLRLVLPDTGRFAEVRQRLHGTWLEGETRSMRPRRLRLGLPALQIAENSSNRRAALEQLGVQKAFTTDADFGALSTDSLRLDRLIETARIKFDERATEAVSASQARLLTVATSQDGAPVLEFNRPFFAFIIASNDIVLFAAQIVSIERQDSTDDPRVTEEPRPQ